MCHASKPGGARGREALGRRRNLLHASVGPHPQQAAVRTELRESGEAGSSLIMKQSCRPQHRSSPGDFGPAGIGWQRNPGLTSSQAT